MINNFISTFLDLKNSSKKIITQPLNIILSASLLVLAGNTQAEDIYPRIVVGGVSGITSLKDPSNSDQFRANGGGLYLHHSGWAPLTSADKQAILTTFKGKEVVVELGFAENGGAWPSAYKNNYVNFGINAKLISANAFANDSLPTLATWRAYTQAFRDAGIAETTLILPTFEYANFASRMSTLNSSRVSMRKDFQDIIKHSGGISLDTPSNYFFSREEAYRSWVIDAIKWTHGQGLTVAIIVSPHNAGVDYDKATSDYVKYLKDHQALPNTFIVENYSTASAATYTNIVGNEDTLHHQLGCAKALQTVWLPAALGNRADIDGDGIANEASGRSKYNPLDFGFEFSAADGWGSPQNISNFAISGGTLKGQTTSVDPNVTRSNLAIDGGRLPVLQVRMKASASGTVQIYWGVNGGATVNGPISAIYNGPNIWRDVSFNMFAHQQWKNQTITSLRIDPISVSNATFEIDWLRASTATSNTSASSSAASSSAHSSAASSAATNSCQTFPAGSAALEYDLTKGDCINTPSLAGKKLQIWRSSTNRSCDFRGTVTSIDGSGSLAITSNFGDSDTFTGSKIRLSPNNGCKFVKVRVI